MPDVAMQDEQEALILESIDRFLERDVKPHVMELEHNDVYPEEIVEKMKELGLFGAIIDEEYGGLGLSCLDRKSVGWGKGVSVRVDLGGGRSIKKKKRKND